MAWTSGDEPPSGQHPAPPCHLPALPSCPLVWGGSSPPSRGPLKLKGNENNLSCIGARGALALCSFQGGSPNKERWQEPPGQATSWLWLQEDVRFWMRDTAAQRTGPRAPGAWPPDHERTWTPVRSPGQWLPRRQSPGAWSGLSSGHELCLPASESFIATAEFREHWTQVCYWARVPGEHPPHFQNWAPARHITRVSWLNPPNPLHRWGR